MVEREWWMRPADAFLGGVSAYLLVRLLQADAGLLFPAFVGILVLWSLAGLAVPGAGPSGMIYVQQQSILR